MSPSGSRMQIDGTSTAARPFCRRASRSSAEGRSTDAAEGFLLSRIVGMTVARRMQRGIVIGNTSIGYAGLSRLAEMSQLSPLCNERESCGLPYAPTRDRDGWMDCRGLDAGAFTQLRARRNARRRRVGRLVELDAS